MEIALSKFCGSDCVITPISRVDEATRKTLGYRGPQNYRTKWIKRIWSPRRAPSFTKHMPAEQVRALLKPEVWDTYQTFTIVRNPYVRAVSRYFWDQHLGRSEGLNFADYFKRFPSRLTENTTIAPLSGENQLNVYLRYETLREELLRHNLEFLWEPFQSLRAKSGYRPRTGATPADLYKTYPEAAEMIANLCVEEIHKFGYEKPV